jgi:hypothetical protein
MTALTYTSLFENIANYLVISTTNTEYQAAFVDIVNDAEQRLYRELDLLNTMTRSTTALTSGLRTLALPSTDGTFVVTEQINVITPSSQTAPDSGTRVPLTPVSKEVLDFLYPSSTGSGTPSYFAPLTQATMLVGPWPDAGYTVEVVGTIRPNSLSASNTTSLLSVYFPDLLFAACMVAGSAYIKNFGAQTDDPRMSVTWESHYQGLLQSAKVEEQRKKFSSQGWSEKEPAPLATPPRT